MKFEIFDPKKNVVHFKLVQRGGGVALDAVDENGKLLPAGHILHITPDGVIRREMYVSATLGLKVGSDSMVVVE